MNIYQRINEVRKAVDYLIKDKKVEGYMAVTHDAVTGAVREHFVKHGVFIFPAAVLHSVTKDTGTTTSRGTPFVRLEIRYRFDVVNADDPTDRFSLEIEAHALDHGDKAPGKALSYAKKYAVLKLLEIETGEEEEGRQEQHKPKNTPTQQTKDAFDALTPQQKRVITDTATQIVDYINEGREWDAYALCETIEDNDEKMALWSRLDSKQRSAIKKQSELSRKKAA
jgi:hypothetical protein